METSKKSKDKTPIKSYKDLIVWQKVDQLVHEIYKTTQHFPEDEQLGITLQMRKAAISASINIAQGFMNRKDGFFFYENSTLSLRELDYLILLSNKLNYTSEKDFSKLRDACEDCSKLLWGWIKALNR